MKIETIVQTNGNEINVADVEKQVKEKEKIVEKYLNENIKFNNVDIRGIGLIWGIDVHSEELSKKIVNECFNNGLILERAGRQNSVVKIMPPLTIDEDTLLKGLAILNNAIKNVLK